MRVLLAGATGTLGRRLLPQLLSGGHEVTGVARSGEGAASLATLGASAVVADVLDRDGLLSAVADLRFDAVVHELTALKKAPIRHADMCATNRLRTTGTAHLLEAAREAGATRFVTQSIVFGYGFVDHGAVPLTEEAPFGLPRGDAFDATVDALASAEEQARSAQGIDGIALRYGLFYGADTDRFADMLRKRMLPVTRDGGEIPFIHHDDAASATVAALERGRPGAAYNIVDDTPTTFAELASEVSERYGAPKPLVVPPWLLRMVAPYGHILFTGMSMRVSNALARAELGWAPRYPSIHHGLAASR
jgi:nucleoside-diphosphate-sugar epimerase